MNYKMPVFKTEKIKPNAPEISLNDVNEKTAKVIQIPAVIDVTKRAMITDHFDKNIKATATESDFIYDWGARSFMGVWQEGNTKLCLMNDMLYIETVVPGYNASDHSHGEEDAERYVMLNTAKQIALKKVLVEGAGENKCLVARYRSGQTGGTPQQEKLLMDGIYIANKATTPVTVKAFLVYDTSNSYNPLS